MKKRVGVIGGGGHVGFGFCLILAANNFQVYGIDINEANNREIMRGNIPFREEGAEVLLEQALADKSLEMTTDVSVIAQCDVIVVVVGTPIDENQNPVFKPLDEVMQSLAKYMRPGLLLVLRSTVSPGTTRRVRKVLEERTGLRESKDFYLVCAPERVAQGNALQEIIVFPQLIGAFSDIGYQKAQEFFSSFIQNQCFSLQPEEAEIGKLITNMTRYVNFALANEYYLLADLWNVDIHRIIEACNSDYPRLNLPTPGPNVGGPCLYKDGFFLIEGVPFPDLITTSFKINESMTYHILTKIRKHDRIEKIGILGMSFKADSDDTRNSLSFKLRKQLQNAGYEVVAYDPYVPKFSDP